VIFGGRVLLSKNKLVLAFKKSIEKIPTARRKNRSSPRYMIAKIDYQRFCQVLKSFGNVANNRPQTIDPGLQAVHGPQLTYLNFKLNFLS
jgi:hypothetical protein